MSEQNQEQPVLKETKEEKAIALIGGMSGNAAQIALIAGDIFKDIDFKGLSTAVEAIGGKAGQLTQEEKDAAVDILDEWQRTVIDRLHEKDRDMRDFLGFFEVKNPTMAGFNKYIEKLEDFGPGVSVSTNTKQEYDVLMKAIETLEDHVYNKPQPAVEDLTTTNEQRIESEANFRKEMDKWDVTKTKLQREVYKAELEWKKAITGHKDVKELLKKARSYSRNVGRFSRECKDKTQIAKLNVNIQSQDVRQSLRDLLEFSTEI